ncbi:MAG: response regulator, partial [Acidobacteria bacterium]|nr:response regulator [Acidobacteriota bacterium]
LPAAAAERRATSRKMSDDTDIMSGSETVLLVEDHTEVRHALRDVLESMGYRVFAAATVAAALELIEAQELDLLLTDLQLPDGVGIDLIGPVRRKHSGLPVVLISGYARGSLPGVLGELPDDVAFVEKPVNTRTLAEALRRALSP